MNVFNENEQNAIIDALKYTSDVVAALTLKINDQDSEIIYLKNRVNLMEVELSKIFKKFTTMNVKKNYSNIELNTEEIESETGLQLQNNLKKIEKNENLENSDGSSNDEIKSKNFEITSIGDTEINKLRKLKAGQLVDKLIQKKNEINNIIEHTKEENDNNDNNEIKSENDNIEKKIEETVVTRRRNKIMRRF